MAHWAFKQNSSDEQSVSWTQDPTFNVGAPEMQIPNSLQCWSLSQSLWALHLLRSFDSVLFHGHIGGEQALSSDEDGLPPMQIPNSLQCSWVSSQSLFDLHLFKSLESVDGLPPMQIPNSLQCSWVSSQSLLDLHLLRSFDSVLFHGHIGGEQAFSSSEWGAPSIQIWNSLQCSLVLSQSSLLLHLLRSFEVG